MSKVQMDGKRILNVRTDDGRIFGGEMFIDATGSAGPMNNCKKFGNGCAMCILRCPSFGGRISLTGEAGIQEIQGKRANGKLGAMSGSCKIFKESLSRELIEELETSGAAVIPCHRSCGKIICLRRHASNMRFLTLLRILFCWIPGMPNS